MIGVVEESFKELTCDKLSRIFITWQLVMLRTIEVKGYNNYIIPHKKKSLLESIGIIRTQVVIGDELMEKIRSAMELENQMTLNRYFPVKTRSRSQQEVNS